MTPLSRRCMATFGLGSEHFCLDYKSREHALIPFDLVSYYPMKRLVTLSSRPYSSWTGRLHRWGSEFAMWAR